MSTFTETSSSICGNCPHTGYVFSFLMSRQSSDETCVHCGYARLYSSNENFRGTTTPSWRGRRVVVPSLPDVAIQRTEKRVFQINKNLRCSTNFKLLKQIKGNLTAIVVALASFLMVFLLEVANVITRTGRQKTKISHCEE